MSVMSITASRRGKQVALMIRRAAAGQSRAPARPTHVSNQLNIEEVAFKTTYIPLMDKPWAERRGHESAWKYILNNIEKNIDNMDSTTKTVDVLVPEARMGGRPGLWEVHGNVWSAALGAVIGAGIVLLIAAFVLMWRKPRTRELPLLAPMDVGHNEGVKIIS
ncbi:unnamed protein product [Arctia plantaginis]|uniref:Uncharacterized protein n=1 Tax=Arctia plantaginis TaxID=874455 RepID=A0A8S1BDW3_ARCPL|nr:unnamed protein product [Arctia plantaginis]